MKTAEDIIWDKNKDIVSISIDETVRRALELMVREKIGALLITREDEFVGIWTERDLMRSILTEGFDVNAARVGDHMTPEIHTVAHDAPVHELSDRFLGLFIRHLLVEKDGEYIGLLSIGDVIRANLLEKDRKFKELNSFASWEYYENWKWEKKDR